MIENQVYKHSGKSNLFGVFIVIGIGAILAIGLGFVYNFLIVKIPFIYINFFIAIGFGLVIGYSVKFLSRFGKIRNNLQNRILAASIGLIGFIFQWIAYLVFLNSGEHSLQAYQENLSLFYSPFVLFNLIFELNKIGSWDLFGITFTDFPLWFIWGIEGILIIGIPALIAYKHPIIPFSEMLNKWYPKYILHNQFQHISAQNQFKDGLVASPVEAINNLSYGEPYRYSEISIYFLPDEQIQYLSVDNFYIEDRGKGKKVRTSVVHLVKINNNDAGAIFGKYEAKKQFVLDY